MLREPSETKYATATNPRNRHGSVAGLFRHDVVWPAGKTEAIWLTHLAIAQEGVTSAIVGIKTEAQLREAATAASFQFPPGHLDRLRKILCAGTIQLVSRRQ